MSRVSIAIPCFGRPHRTRRMLNCLSKQTMLDFEAFLIGDGCPDFQQLIDSVEFLEWKASLEAAGAKINSFNLDRNYGGHGYYIRNYAISNATAPYIVFVDNDDVIAPDHLEFYLSEIEKTNYVMVYYNTFIDPDNAIRNAELRAAGIGHSEIILSVEAARSVPPQTSEYGHDWQLIEKIIALNKPIKKTSKPQKTTYTVTSIGPEKRRLDINID
jgi:hypothetical protein